MFVAVLGAKGASGSHLSKQTCASALSAIQLKEFAQEGVVLLWNPTKTPSAKSLYWFVS